MKERLASIVLRKGWASSREEAALLIAEGRIRVNALVRTDPTIQADYDRVECDPREKTFRYAGRGGAQAGGSSRLFLHHS